MGKERVLNLRTPGPTPCPPQVLEALSTQMINHRGPQFTSLHKNLSQRLKKYFQTKNDILLLTGSGSYGWEAALVNTLSPKDQVLAVSVGFFGDRFAQVATAFNLNVHNLNFQWGKAASPDMIEDYLKKHKKIKAVLVTHNETSTGITNPLKEIAQVAKIYDKLLLVDAVSSLSCIDLKTDEWDCDVVFSAVQKGWMVPPGLFLTSISQKAWDAYKTSKLPKFVFDFQFAKENLMAGYTPFTPPVSLFFALEKALDLMDDEGMENIFYRHLRTGGMVRAQVENLGLELFADKNFASNTVTAVKTPKGVHPKKMISLMREEGVELAGGQGKIADQVFRIGHMGYFRQLDIDNVFYTLKKVLKKL